MARTKFMKFRGKSIYSMLYRPDEYSGQENWKQGLTVTKEVFEKMKEARGGRLQAKFAENIPGIDDGTKYITVRRPTRKEFRTGVVNFCPPYILDKNGKKLVYYVDSKGKQVYQYPEDQERPERKGEPFLIGNGSDIEITLEIYPAGSFGTGARLSNVRVIDLIEYTPSDEEGEGQDEGEDSEETPLEEAEPESEPEPETEQKPKTKVGW